MSTTTDDHIDYPYGPQIRQARIEAGLSQTQLAAATGIDQRYISNYELGRVLPPLPRLRRILQALGGDANKILGLRPHGHAHAAVSAGASVDSAAARPAPHPATLQLGRQRKSPGQMRFSGLVTAA